MMRDPNKMRSVLLNENELALTKGIIAAFNNSNGIEDEFNRQMSSIYFAPIVFQMVLEDVLEMTTESDPYSQIVDNAREIIRRDHLFPDDRNLPIACAAFVCWLEYRCSYNQKKVYKCNETDENFRINKKALQEVVFTGCFNYGTGFKKGLAKKLKRIYRKHAGTGSLNPSFR